MEDRNIWVDLDRVSQVCFGGYIVPQQMFKPSQVVMSYRVTAVQCEGMTVIFDSFFSQSLLIDTQAAPFLCRLP